MYKSLVFSVQIFSSVLQALSGLLWPVWPLPDSGDSNLSKEPGNEVCDIINCLAIKVASGNAFLRKEKFRAQISKKLRSLNALKEAVRFVYFLNLIL